VLDLFLKQGEFWHAIEKLRDRWDINPSNQLPSSELGSPPHPPNWTAPYQSSKWIELSTKWGHDLDELVSRVVPERFRNLDYYFLVWREFFAVCVLFDPPETTKKVPAALLQFAKYGGPRPYRRDSAEEAALGAPRAFYPAVKDMKDWDKAESARDTYWMLVIDKLAERLRPQAIDVSAIVREIIREDPALRQFEKEAAESNPFRYYVEVDDYTNDEDLRQALRMLRAQKGIQLRELRRREPLVAVQAAILYDRHNSRLPRDKRRWIWTYPQLARELGLPVRRKKVAKYPGRYAEIEVSESAEEHVKMGRRILKESSTG